MKLNKRNTVFENVENARPERSIFDLSYEKKFTCDMGQLIPVMCDEVVPGDHFKIGNRVLVRFQPLMAPIMHEISVDVHYFFVPSRILWDDFEEFVTGGFTGNEAPTMPTWTASGHNAVGTLWDYMGLPTGVNPADDLPIDLPRRAYYLIWNEYYRDETLQAELDITSQNNYTILKRAWKKDYFTGALLWQQKGTAPSLNVGGTTSAVFDGNVRVFNPGVETANANEVFADAGDSYKLKLISSGSCNIISTRKTKGAEGYGLDDNVVDLSSATGPDVADLRLAVQLQRALERNARCGSRYTEWLQGNYGVSPKDSRLQRPEFIGGSSGPVLKSEVLQTSNSNTGITPQGNMAGHALHVSEEYCGSYHANEFGWIIGIMSVMPKAAYQQGIARQWLRKTKIDMFNPLFAHLSERAVTNNEIYSQATGQSPSNTDTFGFQGMYNEMRYKPDLVCGEMRSTFDYWHLGRQFGSLPVLDATFITCDPDKRIFAVENVPGLIVSFGNLITAIRPLPVFPTPGKLDHF